MKILILHSPTTPTELVRKLRAELYFKHDVYVKSIVISTYGCDNESYLKRKLAGFRVDRVYLYNLPLTSELQCEINIITAKSSESVTILSVKET